MNKRALVTGVTGMDGSHLADLLLSKGYEVFGLVRRISKTPTVVDGVHILWGDMCDQGSLNRAIIQANPDEVYNFAAQSFVGVSWTVPVQTADVVALGTLRLLESVRTYSPGARMYQASSSEMFGDQSGFLDETSSFKSRSPYGFGKVMAHHAAITYRESYGLHINCGIAFNHESPRRGNEFATKKIVNQIREIRDGTRTYLELGNLDARRDWGYAKEYVEAMWWMLQQDKPDDYVLATGQAHSIRDFVDYAAEAAGLKDVEIRSDPALIRPADIGVLCGNPTKAKMKLGWEAKVMLPELARIMVNGE